MASVKTFLDDPISYSKQRSVYRIPSNVKVNTKKIRLLDFKLERRDAAGAVIPYVFGSGGSSEMIKKISCNSIQGVEIDRAAGLSMYFQNLKASLASNSIQYGINSMIAHQMDLSVIAPDFAEVLNGNIDTDSNYWDINNHYQTINVSGLMQYLSTARSVSDDGYEIVIEWNFDQMESDGTIFTFASQPKIAYDVYLDSTPVDTVPAKTGFIYYSLATESFPIAAGVPLGDIDRKLTSYNKQYIQNMYYFIKNGEDLSAAPSGVLRSMQPAKFLSTAPLDEKMQLIIDGVSLFSKKAITKGAHKQSIFNDQFNSANIPAGSNLELTKPLGLVSDTRFSYGVLPVNRMINDEMILQYSEAKVHARQSALVVMAEVLRGYMPDKSVTYFVNV